MNKNEESQNVRQEKRNQLEKEFETIVEGSGIPQAAAEFAKLCGTKDCAMLTIMVRTTDLGDEKATLVGSGFVGNPKDLIRGLAQILEHENDESYELIQRMIHDSINVAKTQKIMNKFKSGDVDAAMKELFNGSNANLLGAIIKMGSNEPEQQEEVKSTEAQQ